MADDVEELKKELASMSKGSIHYVPLMSRIALLQQSANNSANNYWYKKPIGIIFLTTCGGILVFLIKYLLGF